MRELPMFTNGAMVRGARASGKSAACSAPGPLPHSVQRRVVAALMPGTPTSYRPGSAGAQQTGDHHYAEDQIDALAENVTRVAVRPEQERQDHASASSLFEQLNGARRRGWSQPAARMR